MRVRRTWPVITTAILVIFYLAPGFAAQQGGRRAPEARSSCRACIHLGEALRHEPPRLELEGAPETTFAKIRM